MTKLDGAATWLTEQRTIPSHSEDNLLVVLERKAARRIVPVWRDGLQPPLIHHKLQTCCTDEPGGRGRRVNSVAGKRFAATLAVGIPALIVPLKMFAAS
jgi:hypothetical protein